MNAKRLFIKDAAETESLVKAGKQSAVDAIRVSKALGLTVCFIEKGVIYEELPNGTRRAIDKVQKPKQSEITLIKGMVLHAK